MADREELNPAPTYCMLSLKQWKPPPEMSVYDFHLLCLLVAYSACSNGNGSRIQEAARILQGIVAPSMKNFACAIFKLSTVQKDGFCFFLNKKNVNGLSLDLTGIIDQYNKSII